MDSLQLCEAINAVHDKLEHADVDETTVRERMSSEC